MFLAGTGPSKFLPVMGDVVEKALPNLGDPFISPEIDARKVTGRDHS